MGTTNRESGPLGSIEYLHLKRAWRRHIARTLFLLLAAISYQSADAQQAKRIASADPLISPIRIGPTVNISRSRPGQAHTEILTASDPNDPLKLLVCTMIWKSESNDLSSGVYTSLDGGRTWKLTVEDTSANAVWDPACAFGKNGNAFFAAISRHGLNYDNRDAIDFYQSKDSGVTWRAPIRAPFADREYITVDQTGGKFDGRIYLYMQGDPAAAYNASAKSNNKTEMELFTSSDGASFQGPAKGPKPESLHRRLAIGGPGVVMDDGTFLAPYRTQEFTPVGETSPRTSRIEVLSSSDGGATVNEPRVLSALSSVQGVSCGDYLAMEIDRSKGPFHGRVYLIWSDIRSGRCSVLVAHSDDGTAWSPPVIVDYVRDRRPARGPDSFLPAIAVNRDGVVGMTWYDRRDDPNNRNFRLRFAASFDGGESFGPSLPVSAESFSYKEPESYQLSAILSRPRGLDDRFHTDVFNAPRTYWGTGDTAGLAATADGLFHAFWLDNRTGVQQLYTADVSTDAKALRNGSPYLSNLENLSRECELEYAQTAYDPTSHTITLSFRIINNSKRVILTPLKLRATWLQSAIGRPLATKTENGVEGSGAVWDLSGLIANGRLEPGKSSSIGKLTFRIAEFRPLLGDRERLGGLIQFDSKLYGRMEAAETKRQ